mgnify:CR=1 FL=1
MNDTKQAIIGALYTFCQKRPNFEYGNYNDAPSYRSDVRRATRQLNDARKLLREIELRDSITAEDLLDAAKGGRLDVTMTGDVVSVWYTAGQYYPTEYRAGLARLCANVLWDRARRDMLDADGRTDGDTIRARFKRQFGRGVAARYFN